jgi:hypothetical protein
MEKEMVKSDKSKKGLCFTMSLTLSDIKMLTLIQFGSTGRVLGLLPGG